MLVRQDSKAFEWADLQRHHGQYSQAVLEAASYRERRDAEIAVRQWRQETCWSMMAGSCLQAVIFAVWQTGCKVWLSWH